MLSPEGDLKKYIKLLASLCLVCAVSAPIFAVLSSDNIGFDPIFRGEEQGSDRYEDVYGEALAKGAEETLERSLKERAVAELDLKESEIDIDVTLEKNDEKYSVTGATAYIRDGGIFVDPRKITALVNDVCGCVCTVIYD